MDTSQRYCHFAEVEARGNSHRYEQWCLGIAEAPELLALIEQLPEPKRQPNLVLGGALTCSGPTPATAGHSWTVRCGPRWEAGGLRRAPRADAGLVRRRSPGVDQAGVLLRKWTASHRWSSGSAK
ncbi:DUF2332 family protein [Nocardia sp. CA-129566]|uniref:DUF2332 family protein n=1 Tax=Nocardia sp. CA-129566 TaxID=3239976 RepID=UPI003D980686